jgi:flagellar motor switch protein FliM
VSDTRRISTLDFSQPTKFTADYRRRITRVLGPFCDSAAARLSAELRAPVELRVDEANQLTWSAARAQLPAQTVAVALRVRPIERQMLLEIELPLVLQALECLLGSSAALAPRERRLSEIDWALTRTLLEAIVGPLALAWRDLGGLELTYGQVDMEGDAGVFAPIGEPTFAVKIECEIDGESTALSLLIPWSAIEPVAEELVGGEGTSEAQSPHEQHAIECGVASAAVLLRAEVGSLLMPIEQLLALAPGSTLQLQQRAQDGVMLLAQNTPLGHGKPGLRGARRAVKLTSPAPAASPESGRPLKGLGDGEGGWFGPGDHTRAPIADERDEGAPEMGRMLGVPVRVWAELGRTSMPLGQTLALPPGTVVELDQSADTPIELYAGGLPFAHGSLLVSAGGEWAVQVQELI